MIVSPYTGKVIHHNNCTYCQMKNDIDFGTKSKKRIKERCLLHHKEVDPPNSEKARYCTDYIQKNCTCDVCQEKRERFDIEPLLDKKDTIW